MTTALTILIFRAALATAAARGWAARRSGGLRFHFDQPRMAGRLFDDDRDIARMEHDLDAIRTRFELSS